MVAQCPEKPPRRAGTHLRRKQPAKVMTVDADSGSLLLPKTYITRHGRLVLFAEDPLVGDVQAWNSFQDNVAAREAYVDNLLRETFNGNLLYLAASILVFGDEVASLKYPRQVSK